MDADTDNSILNWLKQIEQVCACLDTVSVNIIVDQAGDAPSLVHDLMRFQPQIAWVSLLENEPENEFIEDAPLFLQLCIDVWQHKEWLSALLRQYNDPARILLFFSVCDFSSLAKYLQNLIIAEWEGRKGLMRFYDTRVFPALVTSVLTEQQKNYFLHIAQLWSWRNRNGQSVWFRGENCEYNFSETTLLTLTDAQYSQLGMISDIEGFIRKYHFRYPEFTKQTLFNHLWQRLQMMDEETPLDNERFFSEYLSGGGVNSKPSIKRRDLINNGSIIFRA